MITNSGFAPEVQVSYLSDVWVQWPLPADAAAGARVTVPIAGRSVTGGW